MMEKKFERQGGKYRIWVMAVLLAGACGLTYYFHVVLGAGTVFTHFFYIPVVFACLWWKRKGLVVAGFLAVLLISSHIFIRPYVLTANDYLRTVMLMVIAFVVAELSERITKKEEDELREAHRQLDANNQQLRASEQQLKAANQQLQASEQQLRAANQQLRASEQQLEAANQQLRAGEQQLKAANQQLNASNQQLRASEQQLKAANQQLQASEQQLRASEEELRRVNHDLQDRVKELNCLYGLSQLDEHRNISLEQIFQGLVELIPPAWEYPEITAARIIFENSRFKTGNFRKTAWIQSADIEVHSQKAGTIQVCYLEERPIIDEGPFLREERELLNALAKRLGHIAERKKAEKELIRLNKILETITSISQDMFLIKDRRRLLESICERIVRYAYKLVWIGFCDERTKEIVPEAQAGFEKGYLKSVKITYNDTKYGKGPTGTAVRTKKPNVMRFIATDPRYEPWRKEALERGYRSSAAVPIFGADKVIGAFNIYADNEDAFGNEEVKLLEELAHDISVGLRGIDEEIRRKQAEEKLLDYQSQLKSLASELTLAEEHERRLIATELHATIGQSLAVSKLQLDALRASVPSADIARTLGEVCKSLDETIQGTRSLTFDISSPILYELGFEAAVSEWLTEQIKKKYGIATEFEDDEQPKPLDDDICVFLFRDVRELLINVVKHAQAKKIKVSVRKVGRQIKVSVEDDGVGFSPAKVRSMATKTGGFGLFSIRERLEQLGGYLEIESEPGHGTRVTVAAPLKHKKNTNEGQE